jgi:tRNA A-37 threonylcarbamoyl transferase component Bud32
MKPSFQPPPHAELLQAGGRNQTGNILYLFHDAPGPRVLKLYRTRRSALREFLKDCSSRRLEGKRGATARARAETEQKCLALWNAEGFAAPRVLDLPLPAGVAPPALWMEFCPGVILADALAEPNRGLSEKQDLLRRVGADFAGRHRRALALREPLLIQEHATTRHLIVQPERLVTFDLENGFRPGFPLREALVQELAGFLRPLIRQAGDSADLLLNAFVAGYAERDRLRELTAYAVKGRGWSRRLKRWHDQRRRAVWPKTEVMQRLRQTL